jgi:Protein of unknown function (DUF2695)
MPEPMDADRKRELKRAFKDRERASARETMLLNEKQLEDLLDHLDVRVPESGCDHSLRLTRMWAVENAVDATRSRPRSSTLVVSVTARF